MTVFEDNFMTFLKLFAVPGGMYGDGGEYFDAILRFSPTKNLWEDVGRMTKPRDWSSIAFLQ